MVRYLTISGFRYLIIGEFEVRYLTLNKSRYLIGFMRLQKQRTREVKGKEYHRWTVVIPPSEIEKLGWKKMDLESKTDSGKLTIKPTNQSGVTSFVSSFAGSTLAIAFLKFLNNPHYHFLVSIVFCFFQIVPSSF